jgi:hypothetical protein
MNAFFDGGDDAIASLQEKRLLIKQKYPKPWSDIWIHKNCF